MVFIVEKFVEEKEKVFNDVLNFLGLVRVVIDVIVLIGVVNFKLNMWW